MIADYHVHTYYSEDSQYPMEDVVKDAIEKGCGELCFTDHVDYGILPDANEDVYKYLPSGKRRMNVDYPRYYEEFLALKEKYGDRIKLKLGLEFGMQSHTVDRYKALFKRYPFDFIILSVHEVNDLELWDSSYMEGKSQREYNEGYYKEILKILESYSDFSVLGHLDVIVRYDPKGAYAFEKVKPLVEEILKKVISMGKGIELNTSNQRYGLADSTPSREILELYRDLGGRIITLGSDSHKPEHLNANIEWGKAYLRELGFDVFCTFEGMKPIFHKL